MTNATSTKTTGAALYLHALTPVHAGTGQASASDIDLPVAREKATNWPFLPATSLKGVLRDAARTALPQDEIDTLFGCDDPKKPAGALQFGDARLLCFPVRSWQGVYACVTCTLALNRLRRDFTALGLPWPVEREAPAAPAEAILLPPGSVLSGSDGGTECVWLDDLKLTADRTSVVEVAAVAAGIAGVVFPDDAQQQKTFTERFAIVSDEVFDFLAEFSTEVTARIKIQDDKKIVQSGGLWYEEAVPAEAIFVAPLRIDSADGPRLPVRSETVIQIGGHGNVGRGLCRVLVDQR